MKKLFTLVTMMSLLSIKVWAGPYFYFTECPQLDYGTTSFNFTSVELKSSNAWTGWQPFNNWDGYIDIEKENFSVAAGDIIRVNFNSDNNNRDGKFKYHRTYDDFSELEGNKSLVNGYFQATVNNNAADKLNNDGLNLQGCWMTMTSVEIIPDKTTFTWTAKAYDGASITNATETDGVYSLNPNSPNITFSGTGYIVITCERNGKKASYLITLLEEGQKRHWDFTRHQLVVGPYGNGAWRLSNDARWVSDQYSDAERVYKFSESINRVSASDIVAETNGGNDKVIWINQDGSDYYNIGYRKLSVRNEGAEFESDHSLTRFIGIEPGVTVKIPNLQAGDRVRMKIDKYGTDMVLNFTNAKDALGKPINGNYQVGGSGDISNDKDILNAYYNFFVESDGTFTFTQTSSQCYLMKIYDIEVYRGDFKQSNEILSLKKKLENTTKTVNAYSIVNGYQCIANYDVTPAMAEQDLTKIDGGYYLHHRGKDETICDYDIVKTSHNLNLGKNDFNMPEFNKNGKTYKIEAYLKEATQSKVRNNEIFGSYVLRIKLYDATRTYITDYADRIVSIGYIEKVNHPITWDFTDLKQYVEKADYLLKETDYADNNAQLDLSIWKKDGNDWRLDYNRYNPNGAPFAWGTQLYAGTKMFDETRGIGFAPINNNVSTSSLKITDDGLRIEDPQTNGGWELTIHELDGLAAVYMRYEPIEGKEPVVRCEYNRCIPWGQDKPIDHVEYNKVIQDSNEKVQAHSALIIWDEAGGEEGRGCTNEFKIYLNNVILKKIATSKDQKKISKPGYATESRRRDIDHSLTSYFTGLPIEAYTGYLPAEGDYSKVVFKRIDNDENHKVLPASTEGVGQSNTGCILYNNVEIDATNGKSTVDGLDGGIHVFVPDMHDTEKTVDVNDVNSDGSNHKNVLLSFKPTFNYFTFADQDKNDPENYIYMEDGGELTFLLSAKKYAYGTNGETVTPGYDVYFVRVDPNAKRKIRVQNGTDQWNNPTYEIVTDNDNPGYAYLTRNCAYIRVPKDKVKELTSGGSTGNAKVSFIFEDELFGEINNGIATGIKDATHLIGNGQWTMDNAEWRTIDGQKLNGMPTAKGLYIMNGKKVMVK